MSVSACFYICLKTGLSVCVVYVYVLTLILKGEYVSNSDGQFTRGAIQMNCSYTRLASKWKQVSSGPNTDGWFMHWTGGDGLILPQ
jgi:hypothetical protein